MSGLQVERSTPLVLLQDAGRFGIRQLGVTQGGGADWISMSWANWLLGNALEAAVIEITLGGLELIARENACLALAGADLGARLDGQPLQPWRSFLVRRGQRLIFSQPIQGARAYLAAPGGFDATPVMGSKATVCREGLGGLDGAGLALAAGDRLVWSGTSPQPRELEAGRIPDLVSTRPLETVLGAQIADFAGQSLFDAFNSPWQVDSRADRMGVRLLGPTLHYQGKALISEGIPLGAIQVPPDGQPIILLNDRQTIGGYPRLGALTPRSLARLAQCLPGDSLRLAPVVQAVAQEQHLRFLAQWH
ncbi:biotin-dependent carboxyltransferase family protein [Pseudomonas gingeri]|uniref:5-oxoprolinase subunit C family protein n=1 Tax=Pseudomonas gingeri TaxID=117681 RepID=UPI0015A1F9E9|nr:biotin-dependent carboxyltransferase family protein [Pseudomonas gingeri]NWE25045.1 biotin-dependent carboxyltransferase family protein [Pseudomonas gingeri]NWE96985.1 biotin-dependent carboxyltransferase family protein [Pseudomonas gingeri]